MNKILLIIQREYFSRVRKKSFLLTTFLVPILIIGLYGLMIFLTTQSFQNTSATIHVVDESGVFEPHLESNKQITYIIASGDVEQEKSSIVRKESKNYLLIIPADIAEGQVQIELFSSEKAGVATQNQIEDELEEILRNHLLIQSGIDVQALELIQPQIRIAAKEITESGEVKESSAIAAMAISMALAILIYVSLFIYGAQVMRGVIEEKNNRIVEVIISSVKPFQLMMGKIVGIGLVGLTQFFLWIIISTAMMAVAGQLFMDQNDLSSVLMEQSGVMDESTASYEEGVGGTVMAALDSVDFSMIIIGFIIYFLGGYMLYSALFAAVGSAVDNETETQQFMLPLTLPLLFAYVLSFGVLINDPNGSLAFWLSMIPFTSPVAMMVRIPFGVPDWQLLLSISLLIVGFIFTTWIAARIYRIGILMYGKKASYRELAKWFRYKG